MPALQMQDLTGMKVEKAISGLQKILPIKEQLDNMDIEVAAVYLAVVNGFYQYGRAPSLEEMNMDFRNAGQVIASLADKDMLTIDIKGEVKGCYPFTMEPGIHKIQINDHQLHAMCALDAMAPAAMFETDCEIFSECAVSGLPVHIHLDNEQILNADEVADVHFGINWSAASSCCSCADSLCTEMLFLIDTAIATAWMKEDDRNRQIFTLPESVAFAAGFFKPMMQQG